MSPKYLLKSLVLSLCFLFLNGCSTGEVALENTEFNFRTIESKLELDKLDDIYKNADLLVLNQVLTNDEKEMAFDKGYFLSSDNREITLVSQRPFVSYKNWLMPTVPGRQVPGIVSQLSYEFKGGRQLALFIVTLNDQVDIKDVAQRSEMIDKLYLSISGSALLIVSSDDESYTEVLQRRISTWKSLGIDSGDYTLYSSQVRDWKFKFNNEEHGVYNINARSYQREKMGMIK